MDRKQTILMNNIESWREESEMKLGDLEDKIHVSKGYFARVKSNNAFPSTDTLIKLSDLMNVTIDFLLSFDVSNSRTNLILIHSLIDKIKLDTQNETLKWHKEETDIPLDNNYVFFSAKYPNNDAVSVCTNVSKKGKNKGYRLEIGNEIICSSTDNELIAKELHDLLIIINNKLNDISLSKAKIDAINRILQI